MPKLNDLKVNMSVTTTFPTDNAYRDALYVALGERAELERRLEATEAALEEYRNAPPIHVSYDVAGGDPDAHRKLQDAINEWRGVAVGGTSPVTGRVRTGDAGVDSLTGVPESARRALVRLARELDVKREEIAVLHARNEDLTRTMHDVAASKDQEIAHMCEKHNEVRDELDAARRELDAMRTDVENTLQAQHDDRMAHQDEVAKLRAEVVRLSAPTPATQYISIITPKDLQGAYERGVEEGRAAALAEAEKVADVVTPAAHMIAQERAIQRAKYTHAHDRKHTGIQWLFIMDEAVKRHSLNDWPRTFRVVGALALAALDVLTVEGEDHLGPVRKKDLTTDHASSDGSCTPPETDHVAEGLAHQPSPAVPMTVAADDIPTP